MDETVLGTEVADPARPIEGGGQTCRTIEPLRQSRGSVAPPPAGSSGFPADPVAAPLSDQAPPVGDDLKPALSGRTVIENDLIRALLEYATEVVSVIEGEEGEEEPTTLEVPFAELVIHRIEEEGIDIQEPVNQAVVKRFSDELDHERILTADQLAQDQDMGVQQKVARRFGSATCTPAPIGSQRHKIYPVVERDELISLLEDSLRRMHLTDLREASREVSSKLEADELSVEEERDLLAQKVQLAREVQATLKHFGTVILP